jgi:hypothetical protein
VRGFARYLVVMVAVAVTAISLSGCIAISGTGADQQVSLGSVKLTVTACANGSPGCSGTSNSASLYELIENESADVQVLLAVRLPDGAVPPGNLVASLGGGSSLAFARSTSYEAELEAFEPAPPGERWWGWLSSKGAYTKAGKQSFTVSIDVSLPRPADGGPFPDPMHWRPVVGGRAAEGALSSGRPVKCGVDNDDLYTGYAEEGALLTVFCIDSPTPEATLEVLTASITDFGILGGAVQASPGTTLTAAFLAKRSGPADPPTIFSLAAETAVPGGTVSLDRSTISLSGDATQPVVATIGVPAGTPPGSYPVTLTGTAPGKPQRGGTVIVTVPATPGPSGSTPADTAPQIRSASLTRQRFRAKPKRSKSGKALPPKVGTKLKVDLSEPAKLSIAVTKLGKRPKALGTSTRSLPAGKSTIAIRGGIGNVRLGIGSHRITLRAEDSAGKRSALRQLQFTVVG